MIEYMVIYVDVKSTKYEEVLLELEVYREYYRSIIKDCTVICLRNSDSIYRLEESLFNDKDELENLEPNLIPQYLKG